MSSRFNEDFIPRIKAYRQLHGVGLVEAKRAVEAQLRREQLVSIRARLDADDPVIELCDLIADLL